MLTISNENIFLILLFVLFYLLWNKFIIAYTKAKLINIKVDLMKYRIEYSEIDKFDEFINLVTILNNNLNLFSLSSFRNCQKKVDEEKIKQFNQEEQEKISSYPRELQEIIFDMKSKICRSILFYVLHRNLILAIISFTIAVFMLLAITIKLLLKLSASKKTISENYDEKCQEYTDKYFPNSAISTILETKAA